MSYLPIFLALFITTIAIVMAGNALDREHALVLATQMRYMQPAQALARAEVQSAIAAQVQENPGMPITMIALPSTEQSVCGSGPSLQNAPCPQYIATANVEGGTTPGDASSGADTCSNANDSSELQEACLSVRITVTLTTAHGSPFGVRSEDVTYRVMNAIPYAILAGAMSTTGGIASGEANAGGCDPSTTATCSATPPPLAPTDTRMHSYDQCQPGLTLCVNPATGQPYALRESSSWNTQGYTDQNQSTGAWQP